MSPGSIVKIKPEWQLTYRSPDAPMAGILQGLSPSGLLARVRMDDRGDFHVLVAHLESPPALWANRR